MELGKQYPMDDEFKRKARYHQSKYRAEVLKVDFDEFGNMLKKEAGEKGLNFYSDFNILDSVYERYGKKYNKQLYSNLLRSEHIPFNLFIPLRFDLEYAKIVLNEFLLNSIKEIKEIAIEFAPDEVEKYLNDRTSFDAYVKYIHSDNQTGILGIEVKYTEQAYPLKAGSKEKRDVDNKQSEYWKTTEKSGVFKKWNDEIFTKDAYRQIWRNHLLGEKIKQVDKVGHFTSITIYPKGNTHFSKVLRKYQEFLSEPDCVMGITYEEFFEKLKVHSKSSRFDKWIFYLNERYLFE